MISHSGMTGRESAAMLRALADQLENSDVTVGYVSWHHTQPVTRPEYGDTIIDHRYMGTTILVTTIPLGQRQKDAIGAILKEGI